MAGVAVSSPAPKARDGLRGGLSSPPGSTEPAPRVENAQLLVPVHRAAVLLKGGSVCRVRTGPATDTLVAPHCRS
jgi:hypothetical protein